MQITKEMFSEIAEKNAGIVDCEISDDCDYGEKFQAVIGQLHLLTIGLHSNSFEQVWQLDLAALPAAWYAGCGGDIAHAEHVSTAGFTSFELAMCALCDITRAISAEDSFGTV